MFKALIIAYGISCGADIGSTANSLAAGNREALIPSQNAAVVASVGIGAMAASSYALIKLHERKPKTATVILLAATAFRGWAAHNNAAIARGAR